MKTKELVKKLTEASDAYYNGKSIMSDEEFDLLCEELRVLSPKNSFFKKVGASAKSSAWGKFKHKQPMGSLLKVVDVTTLEKWASKYTQNKELFWADKLDGLSVSLEYQDGKLVRGVTRGDGEVGEDITTNVMRMDVPKSIPTKGEVFVRGEMIFHKSDWEKSFPEDKNPRNSVSGVTRRLDGNNCELVRIYAFAIVGGDDSKTFFEAIQTLKSYGFKTPRYGVANSLLELEKVIDETTSLRASLSYEIDGVVISENEIASFNKEGEVDGRPRASRAFKFEAQQGVSKLNDVIWQTGRTGVITPVAILTPIELSGVTISRATLCNVEEINRLKVGIGSEVIVKRANDVIPKIVSSVTEGERIKIPTECPSCGAPTKEDGIRVICTDSDYCPAQREQIFIHYLDHLGIKGMGEKLVQKLMESGGLSDLSDLYRLKISDISELERLGEKTAQKVLKDIEDKSRKIPVPKFLGAIGIRGFSTKTAERVYAQYPSIDQILSLSADDLINIDGVGELIADAVVHGLKRNSDLIKRLLAYVTLTDVVKVSGPLSGIVFCFTGFRDKELSEKAKALGGEESESLTKMTTILVAKDPNSGSSKMEKAKKAGVKVLSIEDFRDLLGS